LSEKTIADKLLIKPGASVWLSHASRLDLIGPLPEPARVVNELDEASTAVVFADDAGTLRGILNAHKSDLSRPGTFWVAYPKANRSDINRDTLWPILSEYGMRPIGQVAVDDIWSALRFRPLKEGEAAFAGGRQPAG